MDRFSCNVTKDKLSHGRSQMWQVNLLYIYIIWASIQPTLIRHHFHTLIHSVTSWHCNNYTLMMIVSKCTSHWRIKSGCPFFSSSTTHYWPPLSSNCRHNTSSSGWPTTWLSTCCAWSFKCLRCRSLVSCWFLSFFPCRHSSAVAMRGWLSHRLIVSRIRCWSITTTSSCTDRLRGPVLTHLWIGALRC